MPASRWARTFAVPTELAGGVEADGAVEEASGYLVVLSVGEGRRRSLTAVGRARGRSDCSLAVQSPVKPVEEGSQETLAEAVGRKLLGKRHTTLGRC